VSRRRGLCVRDVDELDVDDLEASFSGLWPEFDALVTENGAVLHTGTATRPLASPVDPAVRGALADHGVAARAGRVLLALAGEDASTAVDVIAGPGLDCQVIRNRGAAMILPAGVTKGTGLLAALDELGLWPHNAIATGDAENDLALLRAAEEAAVTRARQSVLRSPPGLACARGPTRSRVSRLPARWAWG
jgi:hypothetical protein